MKNQAMIPQQGQHILHPNALEAKRWKQQDLADRLEKPKSYISAILHSTANLSLRTVVELEEVLGERIVKIEPKVRSK